ncbi:hypothetical protein MAC_04721 [Metarhizium acridum CQMa 102]|uniref:Uncharacterized protein n=1 Tax=Metarhizium acridum (strain CQMa 102) TaxID=655827 RepID=E9E4C3_METAQ|nr:uncharacterized protein MAC_04721 [Metarhizium acridum CQMa 102]EFY89134.1 hypothetical protein MAC_04721 [Metarhizium acridum CQMa 102]
MPPFVDRVQLYEAVSSQAIPVLEAIAANDHLRSLRRFERDDPPPYVSSTESSEHEDVDLIPRPRGGPMPEELKAIMEQPLTQDERDEISGFMLKLTRPDDFYYAEAHRERSRLDRFPLPEIFFRGLNGYRRQGVIVRHLVKRRWEKLGVWNPNWGFAGRKVQPSDNFKNWTWWWQPKGAADDPERRRKNGRELVARALQLRQNLRRGEHAPVLPRSHLGQDTTAAQAEGFLISRPWFVFQIEVAEENKRYNRLSLEDQRRYPYSARNQVLKWWQERGDRAHAWKWRHESPSPEPEDLAPVKNMNSSPLDVAADMEFTPSEIDEFETIALPKSEQPEGFWVIEESDWPPFFPGQMQDVEARVRKSEIERLERLEKARAEGREIPIDPGVKFCMEKNFPGPGPSRLFAPPQAVQHEVSSPEGHEASMELPEDASEPQRDAACPPPQKRRRLRQQQSRDGVDEAQGLDQPPPPPPRRSARIAGMKRPAELLPSQMAPNKRPRGRAAPKAAAPTAQPTSRETRRTKTNLVPARPLSKEETKTRPRRGPGRPRKASVPSMRSTVGTRPESTPAPAGTRSSRAAGTDAPGMPKRRGRPRKNE